VNLKARLKTLERHQRQVFKEPLRLVVSHAGEPLDLAKTTCTRTVWPNGHLMEIVNLNGGDSSLTPSPEGIWRIAAGQSAFHLGSEDSSTTRERHT